MGTGYEMTAIGICVLGGVSTNGGKGKVYKFRSFATLIMAFLTYTLGLLEVDANYEKDRNRIYPDHRSPDPECERDS